MENLYNTIKNYYDILDNLTKKLQDNYNDNKEFEQNEEDRLALCSILESFDNIKSQKTNESKHYESLCIFDPNTLLADYEKVINDMKEITTIHEFNIVGVKKLAYVIKGFNSGFFVTFKYSLTDEELHKIVLKLKDNKNIIKFINIEDKGDN